MNGIDQLSSPVCTRIALAFAHFVWQGLTIAVFAQVLAWVVARCSARLRYGIFVVSLLSMVLAVFVTYGLLDVPIVSDSPVVGPEQAALNSASSQIVPDSVVMDPTPASVQPEHVGAKPTVESSVSATTGPEEVQLPIPMKVTPSSFDWHRCVPYVMGLYCLGALALLFRLLLGLGGAQRLRRLACPVDDPGILAILQQQSQRIGLCVVPAIALCKRVMVPTVVGVIKPIILLPLGFASELSPQQIEMLIVHELAHIRRYDPLVNVLQRVIEALLFFHPAVWLISYRIHIERENCCDDIVLRTGVKATDYASSLLETAQQAVLATSPRRLMPTELNTTGRSSRVGNRIRRLVGSPARPQLRLRNVWFVVLMLGVIVVSASSWLESELEAEDILLGATETKQDHKLWPDVSLKLTDENGLRLANTPFELSLCIENSEQGVTEDGGSAKSTNTTWNGTETYYSDDQGVVVLASDELFKSARLADMSLGVLIVHHEREIGVFHRVVVPQGDSLETVGLSLIPLCHVRGTLYSSELMGRGFSLDSISIMFWEPSIFPLWHRSTDTSFDLLLPPGKYHLRMSGATKYVGSTDGFFQRLVIEPNQSQVDLSFCDLPANDFLSLIDRPAPELRTMQPWLNGPPIELADLKGKLVLLHLASSVNELDQLVKLHNQYSAEGLAIIAVFNHIGNKALFEQQLFEESQQNAAQIPFHLALDEQAETTINGKRTPGATHSVYSTENPANVLISRQGRIIGKLGWSLRDSQKVEEFIEDLLANRVDGLMGLPRPVLSSELPEGLSGLLTKRSLADEDLRVALKGLSSETDIPIVVGPGVNGVISADLPRLPLETVLDVVCTANGCIWKKTEHCYLVMSRPEQARDIPYSVQTSESLTKRGGPSTTQFFDNEDLRIALQLISEDTGEQIIAGPGVKGVISVEVTEFPLEIMLDMVCVAGGCTWKKTPYYYIVEPRTGKAVDLPYPVWPSESQTKRGGPLTTQLLDNEDLHIALQLISSDTGTQIIAGLGVEGVISADLTELPLEIVLDILCAANHCSWEKTPHYYVLSPRQKSPIELPYPVWDANSLKGKRQGPVVDLSCEDEDLHSVINTISLDAEFAVVVDQISQGKLTAELAAAPLEAALDVICEQTGNRWYKTPYFYFISPLVGGAKIVSTSQRAQDVIQDPSASTNGGLAIQPKVFVHTTRAGRELATKISLDNQFGHEICLTAKSTDLLQGDDGHWVQIEPNATQSQFVLKRSCRKWISLGQAGSKLIRIKPGETHALEVQVEVPLNARGRYTAGISLTLLPAPEDQLRTKSEYIVPVRLSIGGTLPPGAGLPAVAHFAVYPMKYAFKSKPGKLIETKLYLDSLRPHTEDSVSLQVIDLRDSKYRQWFVAESPTPNPIYAGLLHNESCRNWISLGEYQKGLAGTGLTNPWPVDLKINVPPRTQGSFNAGILVCFHGGRNKKGISVKYEFVIPICLEVSETALGTSATQSQEFQAIVKQKKTLKVSQRTSTIDPFRTYGGDCPIEIDADFPVNLGVSVTASSPVGGNWLASVRPDRVIEKTTVKATLTGDGIRLEKLAGMTPNLVVAEVKVTLIPDCRNEPVREAEDLTPAVSRHDHSEREKLSDQSSGASRSIQDQPENARAIALSCIKALRAIEHPRSGAGSAVVQGSHDNRTRKHLVRFKFKDELSRSDILAGLSGAREYVWATGRTAYAWYDRKEGCARVARPGKRGRFRGVHGSDFRPRTFEACSSKMPIADELDHLTQKTDLPLTVTTEDNGCISLAFADKYLFVLDGTKGHRVVEYTWDRVSPGKRVDQHANLLSKSMQISWKRYGTSWYIDKVEYSGFPNESGNPTSIHIKDFVPNIDIDDREFTLEAFDLPQGTKVKDSIQDLEYDWDGGMSDQAISASQTPSDSEQNEKVSSTESPNGEVSGVVVDQQGHPVANASVGIQNSDLLLLPEPMKLGGRMVPVMRPGHTQTDAQGKFCFTGLNPGTTGLSVVAAGYRSEHPKKISSHASALRIVLMRPSAYALSGTVVDDKGHPVCDAEIILADEGAVTRRHEAENASVVRSDESGRFQFKRIIQPIRNPRRLFARKEGYGLWSKRLDGTGGETLVQIVLSPEKTVSGFVLDETGQSIPDASVVLYSYSRGNHGRYMLPARWRHLAQTRAESDGTFLMKGMPGNASIYLQAAAPGYASGELQSTVIGKYHEYAIQQEDDRWVMSMAQNEQEMPVKFWLRRAATLQGTVVYEGTHQPAQGIKVATQALTGKGGHYSETVTDDRGRFCLSDVNPTPCNLMVLLADSQNNGLPEWTAEAMSFQELKPGEKHENLELVLTKGGVIRGTVTDAAGHALRGIDLAFYSKARPRSGAACQSTLTSEDGTWAYRFPPGGFYVYVRTDIPDASWEGANHSYTLKAGQTIEGFDFTLNKAVPKNSIYRIPEQPPRPSPPARGKPENAHVQSAFLDVETIFDAWELRYGHIERMKYKVTTSLVNAAGPGTENLSKLSHREMIMDGEKGLLRWTCDSAGLENTQTVTVESFDGSVGKRYSRDPPHGTIYANRGRVRDNLKAQLCLKYILGANTKAKAKVWPKLEHVAGQPCHVVEIDDPENKRNIRFWFAHAKGMVLLKHELTMDSGEHKHHWQMEAQELGSSLTDAGMFWYPGVLVRKESMDDQRSSEYKVEIHEFVPHIKVSADTFDFQFPKGTPVEDQVTNTYHVEGDTNTPRRQIGKGEFFDIAFPVRSEAVSSSSQETNRAKLGEDAIKKPSPTNRNNAKSEGRQTDEREPKPVSQDSFELEITPDIKKIIDYRGGGKPTMYDRRKAGQLAMEELDKASEEFQGGDYSSPKVMVRMENVHVAEGRDGSDLLRILDCVSLPENEITGWVVDESYCPIADVLVKARPLKSQGLGLRQALELETRPDKNGRYAFPKTIVGEEYLLEFYAPGFEYRTDAYSPNLFAERTTVLRAQPTHYLGGQILHAKTDQGVANAQVVLVGEKVYRKMVPCDSDGYFRFDDVPHNIRQGVVYAKLQGERTEYRMLRKGTSHVDLTLDAACQIKGVVSDSTTGKPIANCIVQAKPGFMSGFSVETSTDENGAYVLKHLPGGEYLVWVRHAEWFQAPNRGDFLEPPEIRAIPGKTVSCNVAMIKKATVIGRVLGPDRLPVVGATVCVKSAQGANYSDLYEIRETGEEGCFELRSGALEDIGHGAVAVISAVADGLGTGSVTLRDLKAGELRNGVDREALIQLSGVMSVSGYVKDPDGNPISGVYVYIHRGQWPFSRTDDSGSFQLNCFPLPSPPNRDIDICFKAPRPPKGDMGLITPLDKRKAVAMPALDTRYYLHQSENTPAKHGRQVELNVVLTPTEQLRISGEVLDARGAPVAQANLVLFAGSVPTNEWRHAMRPGFRRSGFIAGERSHAALCRTVTDAQGHYSFCVAQETRQSLSISHFSKGIDPTVFSIAVESLNGMTRLLHDVTLTQSDSPQTMDISLID
jgi:beta-lactamase regulating signal transducer with metallopeptidase domain/protocatechuate 3,4-dioxygenase beta subunit